jgi:hypothetical protein
MIILVADQDTGTPDESLGGRLTPALHFGFKRVLLLLTSSSRFHNCANPTSRRRLSPLNALHGSPSQMTRK